MSTPIKAKIDVTKILKEHLFVGKPRQDGTQPKYLDIAIWPNKDGTNDYGDTHYITQDIPKAARDAGVKGAIIGNLKMPQESVNADFQRTKQATMATRPPTKTTMMRAELDEDDIPF